MVGQFTATLTHKDKSSRQKVYVVKGLNSNLLGLPAITTLHLAARVDATTNLGERVTPYEEQVRKKFPTVFQGLGDEFTIKLKPSAVPQALYTPRIVPLPLRPQVEEELKRMESPGVISKVDQLTQWCAGMVVVLIWNLLTAEEVINNINLQSMSSLCHFRLILDCSCSGHRVRRLMRVPLYNGAGEPCPSCSVSRLPDPISPLVPRDFP